MCESGKECTKAWQRGKKGAETAQKFGKSSRDGERLRTDKDEVDKKGVDSGGSDWKESCACVIVFEGVKQARVLANR